MVSGTVTVKDAEINEAVADIMPAVNSEKYTANTMVWKSSVFYLHKYSKENVFLSPVEAG